MTNFHAHTWQCSCTRVVKLLWEMGVAYPSGRLGTAQPSSMCGSSHFTKGYNDMAQQLIRFIGIHSNPSRWLEASDKSWNFFCKRYMFLHLLITAPSLTGPFPTPLLPPGCMDTIHKSFRQESPESNWYEVTTQTMYYAATYFLDQFLHQTHTHCM